MQLTVAMVSEGLDPQMAIDMPEFCIADGSHDGKVFLENGVDSKVSLTILWLVFAVMDVACLEKLRLSKRIKMPKFCGLPLTVDLMGVQ